MKKLLFFQTAIKTTLEYKQLHSAQAPHQTRGLKLLNDFPATVTQFVKDPGNKIRLALDSKTKYTLAYLCNFDFNAAI